MTPKGNIAMKLLAAIVLPLSLLACAPGQPWAQPQSNPSEQGAERMEISRSGTRNPRRGPAEYFTGTATITPLFDPEGPSQVGAALVRFEPGARTAWHTHPLGQRLIVTSGTGWTQVEGGPVEEIREGDVVWCPPNVRHWHGAKRATGMAHIAIQESKDGSPVRWAEHVSEAEYPAGTRGE
jgi:quercetin dioxygenase-like cupin family protein